MWALTKDSDVLCPHRVAHKLKEAVEKSRFTAKIFAEPLPRKRWRTAVRIETVRLRNKKLYCGAHPGPCPVNPFFTKKHKVGSWLEGLDWVGFNALLNDVLDKLKADCDVWSYNRDSMEGGPYYIRMGKCRRWKYPAGERMGAFDVFYFWIGNKDPNCFRDCIGAKELPRIDVDMDTPGYLCYSLRDEKRLAAAFVHDDH